MRRRGTNPSFNRKTMFGKGRRQSTVSAPFFVLPASFPRIPTQNPNKVMSCLSFPGVSFPRRPTGAKCAQRSSTLGCMWKENPGGTLSTPLNNAFTAIQDSGVIACLRAESLELAMEAAHAALGGGISVLEIVVSTPGVFEGIQELINAHPSSVIGVGTILNSQDAKYAIQAGAKFLMSPATIKDIIHDCRGSEVLYLPGVMTPTEILTAYAAGASAVKVYPISILGGPQYISTIKKPFPHIPMIASQGITRDSMELYLCAGAAAVVLSDSIFDEEAMRQRNFDTICQLAREAVSRAKKVIQRKRGIAP